ncbi:MAG: MarR family transcriptional regulator [Alcaligenaceae bacterium]|nr:MarR family transcriptional regulator [Alcaligenaceae bacterium]
MNETHNSTGAELLDVIVRLNRLISHRAVWLLPVTLAQARILSQIDALGTTRIGDLALAERCSPPTMTVQVRRLEGLGLVSRKPDPDDARAARVSLTASGRQALMETRQVRADIAESLIDQLDATDRRRLRDALPVLSGLLDVALHQTSTQQELRKS